MPWWGWIAFVVVAGAVVVAVVGVVELLEAIEQAHDPNPYDETSDEGKN